MWLLLFFPERSSIGYTAEDEDLEAVARFDASRIHFDKYYSKRERLVASPVYVLANLSWCPFSFDDNLLCIRIVSHQHNQDNHAYREENLG